MTSEEKIKIENIGRKYQLRFIILHGSYATESSKKGSDFDIAVLGERRIDFKTILEIYGDLADIFGDGPDRELDLKSLHGADPFFRYEVCRYGVLLYGDFLDFAEFKSYAYRAYMDGADLRRTEQFLLKKSIQSLTVRYGRS